MNKYRVVRSVDHAGKEIFHAEVSVKDGWGGFSQWEMCEKAKYSQQGEWSIFSGIERPVFFTLQEAVNYTKDRMEREKPVPKPTTEVVWESDNEQEA